MKFKFSVLLCFIGFLSQGQQNGNEWINFGQDYIKLKIAETGFYRVTSAELQSAGFPVGSVPAEGVSLYRKGREVAIRRVTNSDGITLDYFDFYGQANDGESDALLYKEEAQVEGELSLFTDTATYFVTWNSTGSGSSIRQSAVNDNTGLVPEEYVLTETEQFFKNEYHLGAKVQGIDGVRIFKYDFGEGLGSSTISRNQFREFDFPAINPSTAGQAEIEISFIGTNSQAHNIQIEIGANSASTIVLPNAEFVGLSNLTYRTTVSMAAISIVDNIYLRITALGVGGAAENIAVTKIEIKYPSLTSLEPNSNATFEIADSSDDRSYVRFDTPTPGEYEFFDVTDPFELIRLQKTELDGRLDVVIPGTSSRKKVAAVRTFRSVPVVQAAPMNRIVGDADYLIIYHSALNQGGSVDDYKSYRESEAGGSYNVVMAEIQEIYDQFNFGDPSPIAIKNLMRFGYPEYRFALIIGYGYTPRTQFFRQPGGSMDINIPTYGEPGGDMPYSIGLERDNPLVPAIPVGRLNVLTETAVQSYLNKVVEFESQPFNTLRRKRVLQLSGGQTATEIETFRRYVEGFESQIEGDYLGGSALNYSKTTTAVSETFNISDEVNSGVGLITLFGHSSATVTDIEIGKASDQNFGYANKGKYPLILVNGCNAGDIFGGSITFGEDWISTPEAGAIAFMANAGFALSSTLRNFSVRFYDITYLRDPLFGRTLGESLTDVARELLNNPSELNQVQVGQLVLQGDPAIRPFGAPMPDFETNNGSLQIAGILQDQVFAQDDEFILKVAVRNFAKTTVDSLEIEINRELPDGASLDTLLLFPSVRYEDTIQIVLPNRLEYEGLNSFTVTLDPANKIDELVESNNTADIDYNLVRSQSLNLLPANYSVIGDRTIPLIFQNINLLEGERPFIIEISTDGAFNDKLISEELVSEDLYLFEFTPSEYNLNDTTTIFWRTRVADPVTEIDSVFAENSFTWIEGASSSWGVFAREQLQQSSFAGISLTGVDKNLVFETSSNDYRIRTAGARIFAFDSLEVLVDDEDLLITNTAFDKCELNSINFLFFDSETSQLKRPVFFEGADINIPQICGRLPQRIHNLTENDVLGSGRWLNRLIDASADGDKVLVFTMDSVAFSNWDSDVLSSLESIGIEASTIAGLIDGQPLIAIGEKGVAPGEATIISSDGTAQDVKAQEILAVGDMVGSLSSGTITSPRIGPATSWGTLSYRFEKINQEDSIISKVILVDPLGNETLYQPPPDARLDDVDLSSVDASQFPFIRVVFDIKDPGQKTAPNYDYFSVAYEAPPEGFVTISDRDSRTLQEGEPLSTTLSFINISNVDFTDSLETRYQYRNQQNGNTVEQLSTFGPLAAGDTLKLAIDFPTIDFVGSNDFFARVSARERELYLANNLVDFPGFANIFSDQVQPVLDVKIDGRYIADGEVVSASPSINIILRDENELLLPRDTSNIRIAIRRPDKEFEPVFLSDPGVSFTPATPDRDAEVVYTPGPLADGVYVLRINATDETGNAVSSEPYEISFEVNSRPQLRDFQPFPNPFRSVCRFAFSLTGSGVPEEFTVQIMNMQGKVVKEIDLVKLGEAKPGDTITKYAWDGTNDNGALLGGGLYFFRVILRMQGQKLEFDASSSDRGRSSGLGKIFILR